MMSKSKLLVAVGTLAIAGATLVGAPVMAQDPVTLKVWDQWTEERGLTASQDIYDKFMAANPDIKIEAEHYDFNSLAQLAKTALGSGTGPDVLYFDAGKGSAGQLAENELLVPLTKYAAQYGWDTKFAPVYQRFVTYGELYGLPFEAEFNAIHYNDGLIEELGLQQPTTFDELLQFCKDATDQGYVAYAYGQGPTILAKDMFAQTYTNLVGPDKVAELVFNGEGRWDTPEVAEAIDMFWVQMRDAGCFPEGINAVSLDNALSLFTSGKALALPGGNFFNADLDSSMPDAKLSLAPFPAVEGGVGRFSDVGLGGAWMIASSSKNPDAAAKFLDFLYTDESANTWLQQGSLIPPVAFDFDATALTPLTQQAVSTLGSGKDLGFYIWPAWSNAMLFDVFNNGVQAVYAGDKTPEQLASEMQAQWEKDQAAPAG